MSAGKGDKWRDTNFSDYRESDFWKMSVDKMWKELEIAVQYKNLEYCEKLIKKIRLSE